ncbi:angiopoietin-like protein 8 [Genypterus blacodes]|uniref:angiopoietin-like protein 8 n=1 Tax=Genypterus blacodes TaxID=154954 RepID=UPI003F770A88
MRMKWALCLLCATTGLNAVQAGPVRKTGKAEDKAAVQEDLNVLMYGVIQFSESLNYVYERTEAKIAQITGFLQSREGALQTLRTETQQAAEVARQIKVVIQLLQDQMVTQQTQTKMTNDRLAHVEQEDVRLKTKVKSLETYLDSFPASMAELQERVKEHSDVLKGLQLLTQFQKQNMETQNQQLSDLQEMGETTF